MGRNWLRRGFAPLAQFREGELATGLLMFAYSFLAMTAYNVIKPLTRSKFINSLGADNLPYVQLAAGDMDDPLSLENQDGLLVVDQRETKFMVIRT